MHQLRSLVCATTLPCHNPQVQHIVDFGLELKLPHVPMEQHSAKYVAAIFNKLDRRGKGEVRVFVFNSMREVVQALAVLPAQAQRAQGRGRPPHFLCGTPHA